jgi:hypothetical protein
MEKHPIRKMETLIRVYNIPLLYFEEACMDDGEASNIQYKMETCNSGYSM